MAGRGRRDRGSGGELTARFAHGDVRVGVIGLGYIGLPLALTFAEAGVPVLGFDVDPEKPPTLRAGGSYLGTVPADRVATARAEELFDATADFGRLAECDALIVCVPTPLDEQREPDLSFVRSTADAIRAQGRPGQLVVLESTTYPGTTEEELLPRLTSGGRELGRDLLVAFSPERLDPGNTTWDLARIPKLVGGLDEASADAAEALYGRAFETVVRVSHARVAEAAKLLENVYRAVNIAFVNELEGVFAKLDIDVWEVIAAASTKPFGFEAFHPGPGMGGHCLPIDPFYLAWRARRAGAPSRFIELAGEINAEMPRRILARVRAALAAQERELAGAHVLVLGVAYKSGVSDVRESPGLALLDELRRAGAEADYHDPRVPRLPRTRRYDLRLESVALDAERVAAYDLVLLVTPQPEMRLDVVAASAAAIVDTRNAFAPWPDARVFRG